MGKRKLVFTILTIIWMCIIFSFSARPSEVSGNDSNRVGFLIGKVFVPQFKEWSEEKQMDFAKGIDHPIRKTAHALEYAILGALITGAYIDRKKQLKLSILIPWGLGAFYAATDEFHQLFVPGRSGQISDVALDSTGVLVGVLIIAFIVNRRMKRAR